ncbi:MAG TPA: hypothetical protein VMR44_07230 [Thermoanaerobaculia bacterium]|nr:hypothetical protein [Thermoanaerobaculia bacterium]
MKRSTTIVSLSLLALGLGLGLAPPASAQDDGGSFSGRIVLGFRSVDVDGADRKYREDVNLSDGPRLMDLDLDLTPTGTVRSFVDRIQLDVNDVGASSFETVRLAVDKFGRFGFSYDRWESAYFYEDLILPHELANVRLSSGGDFHHFDFERVRDRAKLDVTLSPRAELNFGFDRFAKRGESTTTLDVSRDEFEVHKPIDEERFEYQAGFQYAWDKVTLIIDERYSEYQNAYSIFLPGFSEGESLPPANLTSLDFFFLDQPYDYESFAHTVRVVARPTRDWIIRASGTLQELSLDLSAAERSQGTLFTGVPFTTDLVGSGGIDRDAELFDLDLTYVINDRFAVIGGFYTRSLDQAGAFTFGGTRNAGAWDIETSGVEAGLEVNLAADLTVSGGMRIESRDVSFSTVEAGSPLADEDESTDHDGFFATLAWRPSRLYGLTLDYETDSFDDPFTLASPTDRSRIRARGQLNLDNGVWGSASFLLTEMENDNSGWDAETQQLLLRAGYRADRFDASLGWSSIELDRFAAFAVPAIPTLPARDYTAESDFIDALLRYRVSDALTLGGELRRYENDGSFALERDDYRLFGEYRQASGLLYRLSYRTIDYAEGAFDFDDYDAEIIDFGVGLSW